jgi:ribosomal protein S6--L-glutamate ligase
MEVNASPGLEGIESYTGVDVASKIISFVERKVLAKNKKKLKVIV